MAEKTNRDIALFLERKLNNRREEENYRQLKMEEQLIDFTSNDYLGLAHSQELADLIEKNYRAISPKLNGSTGSRLLSGNSQQAVQLEARLAKIFQAPSALLFNSGYVANLALLSSIPQKGDTIIYDQLSHTCIKEGARLSFAKRISFRHNDLKDLKNKFKKAEGRIYVAIESVYSMDGDFSPLSEIIKLCKEHGAAIFLDEAHSTGTWGKMGNGLVCSLGQENEIFACVYTFGKGMGVHGACVVGSQSLIDYLINFARPFIYTTALPLHNIISIDSSFNFLGNHQYLQDRLRKNIDLFNTLYSEQILKQSKFNKIASQSAIQAIICPGNKRVKKIASGLRSKGFDVRPILSPTVKQGSERLRICLHTFNSDQEIESLVESLIQANK
ncbi:MAG: 8-amino-7-oxononanoate synthase [Bacteroidetes bacterium]|nr:8-amino-7-oxononanoate synthase [Bacteroidota bacterium]